MKSTEDIIRFIQDDAAKYRGNCELVKAGFLERLLVHSVDIEKLHPNPDDEFCDPAVGPNPEIMQHYSQGIRKSDIVGNPFGEAIAVNKLKSGGYMILNGHHRYAAALKNDLRKVPVKIMNPGTEKDSV